MYDPIEKYTKLFENNADPIIIFDAKTHYILNCNQATVDKYGYSKDDLLQLKPQALHPLNELDKVNRNIDDKNTHEPHTYTHVTRSGKTIFVEINTQDIIYDGREAWISTIRDISQRKNAEDKLKKQYRLLQSLLIISEASRESDLNTLYRIIHQQIDKFMPAKNFYIALLEDVETDRYFFPYYCDLKNEDGLRQGFSYHLPNSFTDWVTRNGALLLDHQTVEKILTGQIHIKVDISQIGQRAASWMGVQLIGRNKQPLGVLVVQDYTNPDAYSESDFNLLKITSETIGSAIQYAQAEKALKNSEKMFRTLVETSAVGINEIDIEEEIVYSNRIFANMLGFDNPREIIGKNLKEFTSPSVFNDMRIKTRKERIKGISGLYETQLITKQGQPIDVIISANPSAYKDNKVLKCMGVIVDITERKKAEKEKILAQKHAAEQEKQALVGQVAGKMAHDFNNILGVILGNTELLLMECRDPEIRKALEIILNQAERGRNLTKNLVAFARDQEPKQEYFNINEKISLAVEMLKKDFEGIRIITDFMPNPPLLLADPGMIEHALINLMLNSIHAMSKTQDPVFSLKTWTMDNTIYIEIKDNGCGIPEAHWNDIYIPSFTLKGSRDISGSYSNVIKGTGYGMCNVKMYIEKHKGTISFQSSVNHGTAFIIKLPVAKTVLTREKPVETETSFIQKKKRILLVEDEDAISEIQQKILMQYPFFHSVDVAANGKTAMKRLQKHVYDLVSLDYILPGNLNGMDIYHYIRRKDAALPILFVSGNIEFLESIKELLKKDPHARHLSKPCNNDKYTNAINRLLSKG